MNRGLERLRGLSRSTQVLAGVILMAMILVLLYAFFTSDVGRAAALLCCGGAVALVVIGLISEAGMRR